MGRRGALFRAESWYTGRERRRGEGAQHGGIVVNRKILIAVAVALGILLLAGIAHGLVLYALSHHVLPRVSERLDGEMAWTRVRSGWGQVGVEGLDLQFRAVPELSVSVDEVVVYYRVLPLLWGDLRPTRLLVRGPRVSLERVNRDVLTRIRQLAPSFSRPDESSPSQRQGGPGQLPELEAIGGRLQVRAFEGYALVLEGIDGSFDGLDLMAASIESVRVSQVGEGGEFVAAAG